MTDVASLLPLVESANQRLLATVSHWAEADVRQPSGLPGWSRAHVLAHLINNADGARAAAWGAARELVIDTYPGGPNQRSAEIEGHARWPAEALVRHLRRAMAELQAAWQAMPEEAWTRTIVRSAGARPAWSALRGRLGEVEVHHVDLAAGYHPSDWPEGFVLTFLPYLAERLATALAADAEPGQWLIQQTDGPGAWTAGTRQPHGVISGPGWALVTWLLGRDSAAALTIEGNAEAALALPQRYPY